ncbi:MtN3 and saliva related transmembrane protein [Methanobacterium lacus]|uniref:MtN3 and saliva related transmembrane protein n=1 Tax=Methanobacterium lacus (strain AL-21) TaxID=877455 RepID=F0T9U2_METLA|nr:MtN3 and saliva related protein [Methanobacterium lacus]ADZ09971.1 MtN3 and saliva related transmembrane protein [Methanobacterium lacus]
MSINAIEVIGSLACLFTFLMYLSTIDQMRTVLKTENSEEVSEILYWVMFFNCFFWSIYGLYLSNNYILIPNFVGCVLSLTTAAVVWKYR